MKSITRPITGLLIIAVGLAFLLTNLDILPFTIALDVWWPMLLIVGGVIMLLNDVTNYLWAIVVMTLGAAFQLRQLDIIDVNPWQLFWPMIIIIVGISVMRGNRASRPRVAVHDREDITAILGGSEAKIQSKDYKGSRVIAVAGGAVLDLRKATIQREATIDLFTLWGGIEIYVPKDVIVKNQASAILGGVENSTEPTDDNGAPVLYVIGDVVMAGVEIKN